MLRADVLFDPDAAPTPAAVTEQISAPSPMPAPDRDKLLAGLSGILSGTPEPVEPATPPATPSARKPDPARDAPRGVAPAEAGDGPLGRGRGEAPEADATADEGEHVRTTTGYVRADGERVHRVSIMLTKGGRRRLRDLAEDEGVSVTDLVRRSLRL